MLSSNDIETLGRLTGSDMVNRWNGLIKKLSYGYEFVMTARFFAVAVGVS